MTERNLNDPDNVPSPEDVKRTTISGSQGTPYEKAADLTDDPDNTPGVATLADDSDDSDVTGSHHTTTSTGEGSTAEVSSVDGQRRDDDGGNNEAGTNLETLESVGEEAADNLGLTDEPDELAQAATAPSEPDPRTSTAEPEVARHPEPAVYDDSDDTR